MHPLSSIRPSDPFCWRRPCIVLWMRSRRHCRDWRRKSKNSRLLQGKKWQDIATSCHIHDFLPLFTGRWLVLLLGQSLSGSHHAFPISPGIEIFRADFSTWLWRWALYSMCEHWLFVPGNVPLFLRTLLRGRISYFWPPDLSQLRLGSEWPLDLGCLGWLFSPFFFEHVL